MKKSYIDVGTIGSRPCEVSLNSILMGLPDDDSKSKIIRKVMSRLLDLKHGLDQLRYVPDKGCRIHLVRMFYNEIKEGLPKDLPPLVYSHTLCCMAAHYKTEMRVLNPPGRRRLKRITKLSGEAS